MNEMKYERVEMQIGGKQELGAGEVFQVTNPATTAVIAEVPSASAEQVGRAVAEAQSAFIGEELGTPSERGEALGRLADLIEERQREILETVVAEVGTPITTARAIHIDIPVALLRGFAEAAIRDRTEHLGVSPGPPANEAMVVYRPVGVVAGITAYNGPLMFAAAKVGAAFAAGCPSVLLSSPQAPLATLKFAQYALEAGFPERAVSVLAGGAQTAQELIASPDVAKVSFTGSVPTGVSVMKQAAEGARGVVLELGGKSASILLPSSDAPALAERVLARFLRNAGQGCAAPTRILVHESQIDDFVVASRDAMLNIRVGDPQDPETLVGPVISPVHRDRVLSLIDSAIHDGGDIIAQGSVPEGLAGWYVPPTLIGGLGNGARINQEEVFGPVGTVQSYRTVDEAVQIANDSSFGLHASVFGKHEEALALASRLIAGHVTINGGGPMRGDAPIGGRKASGIGRENGDAGVREFLEPVTIQWPVP